MNRSFPQRLELAFWDLAIPILSGLCHYRLRRQRAREPVSAHPKWLLIIKTAIGSLIGLIVGIILGFFATGVG
jgi:hypothetical protein